MAVRAEVRSQKSGVRRLCRRLQGLMFLLITGHWSLVTASGQVVDLRTAPQTVFTSVACAGAPLNVNINNRGLTTHYLVYQTSGTINSLSIEFEGRNDDTLTWQRISDPDTRTTAGAIFATVYLNFIRVSLTACSGTGTITASYSGTAVAATPTFGGLFVPSSQVPTPCTNQDIIQFTASGAGSTRIITAAGGGRQVVLCHLSVALSAAVNIILERGTGTNCGTGNTDLTGAYQNTSALALDFGASSTLKAEAVNSDICVNVSGATTVGGVVIYAEF